MYANHRNVQPKSQRIGHTGPHQQRAAKARTLGEGIQDPNELALRDAAWHVELDARGGLVWRAPQGSDLQDATSEPGASVPLQLLLLLLGPLAPDHLL